MTTGRNDLLKAAELLRGYCKGQYDCACCPFRRLDRYFTEYCALGVMKKPSGWNIEDEDEGEGKENDQ